MKVQYCSDLHLEFPQNRKWLANHPLIPSGEILIIAGDTHYLGSDFENLDFFKWVSDHYEQAYVIPGNHEYYGGYDLALHQKPFQWELQPNVFLLNNQAVEINSIGFLFSTLWTHIHPQNSTSVSVYVNDFHKIRISNKILSTDYFNQLHAEAFDFISTSINDYEGETIVVRDYWCFKE